MNQHFSTEDIPTAKSTRKVSASLVIGETKIKNHNELPCHTHRRKEATTNKCHVRPWFGSWNNNVTLKKQTYGSENLEKKTNIKSIPQSYLCNSKINANTHTIMYFKNKPRRTQHTGMVASGSRERNDSGKQRQVGTNINKRKTKPKTCGNATRAVLTRSSGARVTCVALKHGMTSTWRGSRNHRGKIV